MFTREFASLKRPMLLIFSHFLEYKLSVTRRQKRLHHTFVTNDSIGRCRLTAGEKLCNFRRGFQPVGETANTTFGFSEGLFGLLMCYTPPVKNPVNPWILGSKRMPTQLLI
jgi:hypothetical protein